jgi:hypothetical protein
MNYEKTESSKCLTLHGGKLLNSQHKPIKPLECGRCACVCVCVCMCVCVCVFCVYLCVCVLKVDRFLKLEINKRQFVRPRFLFICSAL